MGLFWSAFKSVLHVAFLSGTARVRPLYPGCMVLGLCTRAAHTFNISHVSSLFCILVIIKSANELHNLFVIFQTFTQHSSPDFISGPAWCLMGTLTSVFFSLPLTDYCVCVWVRACAHAYSMCTKVRGGHCVLFYHPLSYSSLFELAAWLVANKSQKSLYIYLPQNWGYRCMCGHIQLLYGCPDLSHLLAVEPSPLFREPLLKVA